MKTIEIIVTPTGELTIDVVGFKGADCEQATCFIEEALGPNTRRVKKPEHFVSAAGRRQQGIGS